MFSHVCLVVIIETLILITIIALDNYMTAFTLMCIHEFVLLQLHVVPLLKCLKK